MPITRKTPLAGTDTSRPDAAQSSASSSVTPRLRQRASITSTDATSDPGSPGYKVGYGKPPLHARFKPGQSGNPRGRPKRAQSLKTLILETLSARITVRTAGGEKKMSKLNALIHKLVERAMKGNDRAMAMLLSLYESAAPEPSAQAIPEWEEDLTATDFAALEALKASWAAEQGAGK